MGNFGVIYADPPWAYDNESVHGAAADEYDTCPVEVDEQFRALVDGWAAPDSVLFMWATWPKLVEAVATMQFWGFRYVTCGFLWVKTLPSRDGDQGHLCPHPRPDVLTKFGIGFHAKSNTEFCLLGKRGRPAPWSDNTIRQLVFAPPREHSRKPDEVRDLIVRAYPDAARIEMFARVTMPGWISWGNDVGKFDQEGA